MPKLDSKKRTSLDERLAAHREIYDSFGGRKYLGQQCRFCNWTSNGLTLDEAIEANEKHEETHPEKVQIDATPMKGEEMMNMMRSNLVTERAFSRGKRHLIIKIPALPPKEAGANYRPAGLNVFVARKAIKEYQRLVFVSARDATSLWERVHNQRWQPLTRASLTVTFVVKNRRYIKDDDGAITSLKGAIDVLTCKSMVENRAEIIGDDSPECLHIETPPKWVAPYALAATFAGQVWMEITEL